MTALEMSWGLSNGRLTAKWIERAHARSLVSESCQAGQFPGVWSRQRITDDLRSAKSSPGFLHSVHRLLNAAFSNVSFG
jgi:hypothetical protein